MNGINEILLIGNLATDVSSNQTQNGNNISSFSLAVDRKWPDKGQESLREVDYHKVVCWNKLGELANKILHKGDKVLIIGSLLNHSYANKDGEIKYVSEIHADKFEVLHWKKTKKESKKSKNVKEKELATQS